MITGLFFSSSVIAGINRKVKKKVATLQSSYKTLGVQVVSSTSVTLAWSASSSSNVISYRMYKGQATGVYTENVNVGNVLTGTFSNLLPNTTYYSAVKAVNGLGAESNYSNEVFYTTSGPTPDPLPTPIPAPTTTPVPSGISFIPTTLVFYTTPGQSNVPSKQAQVFTSNGSAWRAHDVSTHFHADPQDTNSLSGTFLTVTPYNGLSAGTYNDPITITANGLTTKNYVVTIIVSNNPTPVPSSTPAKTPTPTPAPTASPVPTAPPSPSPSPSCTPCRCG